MIRYRYRKAESVMGGRGTTGKTKLFTNIDAARNVPLREARAKEIEAERAAIAKPISPAKSESKLVMKRGTVSALVETGKDSQGYPTYGRRSIDSFASSGDGRLHVVQSAKDAFHVIDATSGSGITTVGFGNKKKAISFLRAATRADGTISPTLKRSIEFSNTSRSDFESLSSEKRSKLTRAYAAVSKLRSRIENGGR